MKGQRGLGRGGARRRVGAEAGRAAGTPGRAVGPEARRTRAGGELEVMGGEKGAWAPWAGKVVEMGACEVEWAAEWLVCWVGRLQHRAEAGAEGIAAGQSLEI